MEQSKNGSFNGNEERFTLPGIPNSNVKYFVSNILWEISLHKACLKCTVSRDNYYGAETIGNKFYGENTAHIASIFHGSFLVHSAGLLSIHISSLRKPRSRNNYDTV
jgi:hypothetical protein